jgi:glutamyl-tRNA synthetase
MDNLIEKFALENALRFKGKANPGAVMGSCIQQNPDLKKDMKSLAIKVNQVIKKINSMSLAEQKKKLEKIAPELLEKKKGEKKGLFDNYDIKELVVTAFPPEPSKYPHIGHAKALLVNYEFAKKFNGEFVLRFEDTNPELAKNEFYKVILNNLAWLEIIPDRIEYASDHMIDYYRFAEKLVSIGKAYVCTCSQEKVRESRMKGKACDCRYKHIEEHMIMWRNMHEMKPGDAILRLKIDPKHKNSTMRDPTIFRIIKAEHPRLKNKFTIWPNYDFENSIMDGLQGITHRFRSKEFEMRNELQRYIQKLLDLPETEIYEFARFNMKGVPSSGRIIRDLIEKKELVGWDDPTLTTLVALRRRGFTPEAIKSFVLSTGITKNESTLTWDDLIVHNKRVLDATSNRYFFMHDPVRVRVQDAPSMNIELKLHPEDPKRGKRSFKTDELFFLSQTDINHMKDKKLYRLMDCLNFVKKNGYFIFDSTDYESFKKGGDKIIHWLPFNEKTIDVEIMMPDKKVISGIAESSVSKVREGDIIQFERFGFCRLDEKGKTKLKFWFTHK